MSMTADSRRLIVGCLLVSLVLASGPLLGVASSDYAVSTDSETDAPTRTVEIEGTAYTISSVATGPVDGSTAISVEVPDGAGYVLDIYNDDEQAVIDSRSGAGSQTETIDLSGIGPGTYAIVLQVGGNVEAVKPLVVEGVSVSVSVPGEIEAGESLTATVETDSIDGETTPQNVEVAVWNGDDTIRVDATETADGTYEATVEDLAAGDYRIYAAAQGSGTVMGEPNAIGVGDDGSVTVSEESGGDPGGGDSDDNETNSSTDDNPTDDDSDEETDGSDGESDDGSDNDSDTGPQTPIEPEDETGDDDSDSVPFAGPAILVVSLSLLLGGSLHRRLN